MNPTNNGTVLRPWLVGIVVVHLANAIWHGAAHRDVPVPLTALQTAFVVVVIIVLPLVGAGLLWTNRPRLGAAVIALSMFGSLVFGFANHFVLDSADNVTALPEHDARHAFVVSAALLLVTETVGTVLGAVAALRGEAGPGSHR